MELDLLKIKFSNNDLRRNIRIPNRLNPELAEFIGIIVGDGHVGNHIGITNGKKYIQYENVIVGNKKDLDYYLNHVNKIAYNIFRVKFNICYPKKDSSIMLYKYSKAINTFLSYCIGIPNRKGNIRIPSCIIQSSLNHKSSFLKGLADADFTFTVKKKEGKPYPVVQGCSKSEALIDDVSIILKELKINHCLFLDKTYNKRRRKTYVAKRIYINGNNNVKEWFDRVGFSNSRHINRWNHYIKLH